MGDDNSNSEEEGMISPFAGFASHKFGAPSSWSSSSQGISSFFLVYLTMLTCALTACRLLEGLKETKEASQAPGLSNKLKRLVGKFVPEAGVIILVGIAFGGPISYAGSLDRSSSDFPNPSNNSSSTNEQSGDLASTLLTFSPTTFFLLLLPPIIFNSGYHMNRSLFFPLLPAILGYAIFGTMISTFVVGVGLKLLGGVSGFDVSLSETLAFGALISATDPVSTLAVFQAKRVDPVLFYLVFGESVLNDAVGLVLYETLAKFIGVEHSFESIAVAVLDFLIIFVGSTVLGVFCGLVASGLSKVIDFRHTPLIEGSLFVLVMYAPFTVAEVLSMSGIVTILFTGITFKAYGSKNLGKGSKELVDGVFRMMAHLSETAIFMELGLACFSIGSIGSFHLTFVIFALLLCLVARSLNVYPISFVMNRALVHKASTSAVDDDQKNEEPKNVIDSKTQHMLFFSGLRGAVAFACAISFPNTYGNRDSFIVTTMIIVLVTVFGMGGGTESVLEKLGIASGVDEDTYENTVKSGWGGEKLHNANHWIYHRLVRDDVGDLVALDTPENSERFSAGSVGSSNGDFEMAVVENDTQGLFIGASSSGGGSGSVSSSRKKNVNLRANMKRRGSAIFDFGGKKNNK
ncbi:hypothetical protein TrLO_g1868 [Triparma laevis f. longispina]|uniref:Sodium/hydrogen exchanger n=1 Tax=Triparma laevis f. longispina TaxID=1714387 RepID=A0A9W7A746_9STRA|nr:hypothetical protein TrLO_g1868 [Triparma laevis f. longispina]